MGLNNHYRSVSTNDESFPLSEKSQSRAGWGKQSLCLSVATGTLFIAIIVAIFSLISSVFVSHNPTKSDALSTSATSAAAVVASTTLASTAAVATSTPLVDDDSIKSTEGADDSTPPKDEIQNCGYTPDEARARGCVFDVMMQLWTPAACFDEPLSNRFLEVGNWTWYADPSASHIFTLEEMRKGEHDAVYVAQDYHITHCIYAWEKLVRSMRNQQPLITELISYDHVIHCRHKTLQRADGGNSIRGVRAPTGYTQCAPYDTWKNHLPANEHSSTE
ncbi:hypothetical protein AYL99_06727 [Fonsecaea erecta]|uniref:Uncharacterized protein n=1 Tax=Fonsecaea erecta TaxID=1367422 RepID=A0A178ZHZ6_9EURO|nr:hypothetical protein AYL99_06727 [Fonsecaea erecta]OAP59429.1 hypothetical protein AYL99_06727 [Fonsecaea erecta]